MAAGPTHPTQRGEFDQIRSEWIGGQEDYQRAIEMLEDARRAWKSAHGSRTHLDPENLGRIRADVDRALERVAEVHAVLAKQFERSHGWPAEHPRQNVDRVASQPSRGFWIERMVGLGLVFTGLVVLYAMTVPTLTMPWYGQAMLDLIGLPSLFFGLPLLVTGHVRQAR